MKRLTGVALLAALAVGAGCATKSDEPTRYHLSGTVTLDGLPIPFGEVVFTPDAKKKATGPQGIAPIKDGRYDTRLGKGVAGGPTVIRVNGMSGPGGKTLCEHEMAIDLPRADGVHDIALPKSAMSKPGKAAPEI